MPVAQLAKVGGEWEALADGGHEGLAFAKALQLTRLRSALAAARREEAHAEAFAADALTASTAEMQPAPSPMLPARARTAGASLSFGGAAGQLGGSGRISVGLSSPLRLGMGCANLTVQTAGVPRTHPVSGVATSDLSAPPPSAVASAVALPPEMEGDERTLNAEPNKRAYLRAAAVTRLPAAVRDTICAIEMMRKLPKEIWQSIFPVASLLMLLRHPSRHVRDAALPLLRRDLTEEPPQLVCELIDVAGEHRRTLPIRAPARTPEPRAASRCPPSDATAPSPTRAIDRGSLLTLLRRLVRSTSPAPLSRLLAAARDVPPRTQGPRASHLREAGHDGPNAAARLLHRQAPPPCHARSRQRRRAGRRPRRRPRRYHGRQGTSHA